MNVKNFCPLGRLKQLKSRIDKMKNRTENVFYVWWAMKFKNSDNLKTLKTFGKDPEQLLCMASISNIATENVAKNIHTRCRRENLVNSTDCCFFFFVYVKWLQCAKCEENVNITFITKHLCPCAREIVIFYLFCGLIISLDFVPWNLSGGKNETRAKN